MIRNVSIIGNENGTVLMISVIMLAVATAIGLFAMNTANVEIQVAGNYKNHVIAFHNADSGIYGTPKLVSKAVNDKATPYLGIPSAFTYLDAGASDSSFGTFFRELSGIDPYDTSRDVDFSTGGELLFSVDVERVRVIHIAGGGAEFASGTGGGGVSLTGIHFNIDSLGHGPVQSQSNILARYLKVIGVAGGL